MEDGRPVLMVVIASTRPGRVGAPVARWFEGVAREHGAFALDVVDLAELALPFLDEPRHPRLGEYEHDHTKRWSARVAAADAFVFVHPEYNHGVTAPLKNAIDFLSREWAHKPLGLVSYGGIAGGTRAAAMIRLIAIPLNLVSAGASVTIPFVSQLVGDDGEIAANPSMGRSATALLDELVALDAALRSLRQG